MAVAGGAKTGIQIDWNNNARSILRGSFTPPFVAGTTHDTMTVTAGYGKGRRVSVTRVDDTDHSCAAGPTPTGGTVQITELTFLP